MYKFIDSDNILLIDYFKLIKISLANLVYNITYAINECIKFRISMTYSKYLFTLQATKLQLKTLYKRINETTQLLIN